MRSKSFYITVFGVVLLCLFSFSSAYGEMPEKSARIVSFKGDVYIKSKLKKQSQWVKITKNDITLFITVMS